MSLQAIQEAYQRGDLVMVRKLVEEDLSTDPNNEQLWVIKMLTAEHGFEREAAMMRVLALNPENPQALQFQQQVEAAKQNMAGATLPPDASQQPAPAGTPMQGVPSQQQQPSGSVPMQGAGTPQQTPSQTPSSKPMQSSKPQKKPSKDNVYEMLWDCEYCGTTGLLGLTHRFCPHCGAPQNPDKRYFPSDEEKVAVADHEYYGADVICTACETLNSAKADYCQNCGAPLSEGAKAKTLESEAIGAGQSFGRGKARDLVKDKFEAEQSRIKADDPKAKVKSRNRMFLALGSVVTCIMLCLGAVGVWYFSTDNVGVVVTEQLWEREIRIESLQALDKGDWCDDIPSDAYNVDRSNRNRTRQVQDGETCETRRIDNGDGTFREVRECQPKYRSETYTDQWCDYTVNSWEYDHSLTSNGGSSEAPYWQSFSPAKTGNSLGAEREAGRDEKYVVHFEDKASGKTYTCEFDHENQWVDFSEGSTWSLEVGSILGEERCDTLKRQ